ncbi:MAG: hypothetical protein EOO10_20895 [Chitinophagaceae bacterium]|nr:MAG: hypothetical protein EOO10_20895 [Chitinophagaceae bacterium]
MSTTLLMPGYKVCQYRLIIPLSEALQETVTNIRKALHDKYRVPFPFHLKPGLTILQCHAYEGMETKLVERIQGVAGRSAAFKVELQNFTAYPSHSIYIHVATRSPFNELVKELKVVRSLTRVPDNDPQFIKEPQLVVAQKLKPFQFTRMWMDCEHTLFTGRFTVEHMLLMKRSETNPRYELLRQFDFASAALCIKQGTLFG